MDFFCWGGASGDLPHIHGEKITQAFFGPIRVKSGFHDAIEEGDRAITLDKNDFIECFFLARAPCGDDVIVDLRCRYHGIYADGRERTRMFQFYEKRQKHRDKIALISGISHSFLVAVRMPKQWLDCLDQWRNRMLDINQGWKSGMDLSFKMKNEESFYLFLER